MKVLVLAGGFDQIALINELKKRGHEIYLADYFENPPAKKYADKHFQVSTLDEEAIFELAEDKKIELITTACTDQALMTVARVSERMGLPCYISANTAANVTNKVFMKKKFFEYNVPTAKCLLLEDEANYKEDIITVANYPMIVKPCDCNSSKGVIKVMDQEELFAAIEQAFALSRSKKVIVEEFIEGDEVSIDVWKDSEGAKVLSVSRTGKIEENKENFTIYQSTYPVELTESVKQAIQETATNICEAFELENCPVLIQAIINGDKLSVIEFSARMGGGSKYKLIEYLAGVNIMEVYVNRVLGDESQIITPVLSEKKIELNYVYTYNGVVSKIVGFERFVNSGDIKELFQYRPLGCVTEKRTTSSDRILGFLIERDSSTELRNLRNHIINAVDILNDKNESIMYKKCFQI